MRFRCGKIKHNSAAFSSRFAASILAELAVYIGDRPPFVQSSQKNTTRSYRYLVSCSWSRACRTPASSDVALRCMVFAVGNSAAHDLCASGISPRPACAPGIPSRPCRLEPDSCSRSSSETMGFAGIDREGRRWRRERQENEQYSQLEDGGGESKGFNDASGSQHWTHQVSVLLRWGCYWRVMSFTCNRRVSHPRGSRKRPSGNGGQRLV